MALPELFAGDRLIANLLDGKREYFIVPYMPDISESSVIALRGTPLLAQVAAYEYVPRADLESGAYSFGKNLPGDVLQVATELGIITAEQTHIYVICLLPFVPHSAQNTRRARSLIVELSFTAQLRDGDYVITYNRASDSALGEAWIIPLLQDYPEIDLSEPTTVTAVFEWHRGLNASRICHEIYAMSHPQVVRRRCRIPR